MILEILRAYQAPPYKENLEGRRWANPSGPGFAYAEAGNCSSTYSY